jgi:hypothetical protein
VERLPTLLLPCVLPSSAFANPDSCCLTLVFSLAFVQWQQWRALTLGHNCIYVRLRIGSFPSWQNVSSQFVEVTRFAETSWLTCCSVIFLTAAQSFRAIFPNEHSGRTPSIDNTRIVRNKSSTASTSLASGISRDGDRFKPVFRGHAIFDTSRSTVCRESSTSVVWNVFDFYQCASCRRTSSTVPSVPSASRKYEAVEI